MLRALSHNIDVGIVNRTHLIIDDDGPLYRESAARANLGIGRDAG